MSIDNAGFPFIRNYTKTDYQANGSNQAITQDHRQIMYFGNQDGILEFDGTYWNLIPTANRSFPKALAVEKYHKPGSLIRKTGRLYTGGIGEFGYLEVDSTGNLVCRSLVDLIPAKYRSFEDIFNIKVLEHVIVFQSFKYLFLLINDQIKVITPSSTNPKELFHLSFLVDDQYFIRQWGKGLLQLEGEQLVTVPGGEAFAFERIYEILPFSDSTLLIATRSKGLMLFDGKQFTPWQNQANNFLIKHEVYCGARLDSDTFVFGTVQGGIVVVNKTGVMEKVLNKQSGLLDNLIFDLFVDKDQNLWVGQTNGISYVAFDSPFSLLDERINLEGQGFIALVYNQFNWLGTLRNLYRIPVLMETGETMQTNVQSVPGSNSSTMNLLVAGDVLLAAQTTGIIAIDHQDKVTRVLKDRICFSFLQLKNHPDYVIVGTNTGLVLLENMAEKGSTLASWQYKADITGFEESVFYLAEGIPGEVWIGDEQKGIFRLQLTEELDRVTSSRLYDSGSGLPADINNRIYSVGGTAMVSTESGIYRYDSKLDSMTISPEFENIVGHRFVHSITEDNQGGLWIWAATESTGTRQPMEMIRLVRTAGTYTKETGVYRQLNDLYRSFYPEVISFDDQHVLFVKPSGFISHRIDSPLDPDKHIPMLIREVSISNNFDSLIYAGHTSDEWGVPRILAAQESPAVLPYKLRNLMFKWSALSYTNPEKTLYSFQLEGFDQSWSDWGQLVQKEYTNIQYGNYRFMVRARNVLGQESEVTIFTFEILRPWYLTWHAIAGYVVTTILLVYGIVRINIIRLVRQKEALEKVVRSRTKEIRLQKTEIENEKKKSDELLLNILPQETAEELKTHGSTRPRHYVDASVMFTDFCDFTSIGRTMEPDQLVALIDHYFTKFDEIITKYPIEKIKTIGDSFMCAAGIPTINPDHAIDLISAALEIKSFVKQTKEDRLQHNEPYFDIRIGISSGPLIAGVVGSKKYAYDIWGATVNLASRVETTGPTGEVNISESTYQLAKDYFECEYYGKADAKNIGLIDTYLVRTQKTIPRVVGSDLN